jgi:hypothetical protein
MQHEHAGIFTPDLWSSQDYTLTKLFLSVHAFQAAFLFIPVPCANGSITPKMAHTNAKAK